MKLSVHWILSLICLIVFEDWPSSERCSFYQQYLHTWKLSILYFTGVTKKFRLWIYLNVDLSGYFSIIVNDFITKLFLIQSNLRPIVHSGFLLEKIHDIWKVLDAYSKDATLLPFFCLKYHYKLLKDSLFKQDT